LAENDRPYEKHGVLIVSFKKWLKRGFGTSLGVKPQKVHSGRFYCGTIKGIELKKYDRRELVVVLKLVPPRGGGNIFKPSPQNKVVVSLRDSFQNFLRPPLFILSGSPLPGEALCRRKVK